MTDPIQAAKDAATPETFDFVQTVQDRNYPEFPVPVYLDERKVVKLIDAYTQLELARGALKAADEENPSLITDLADAQERYDNIRAQLKADEYVILVRGIPPEDQVGLEDRAYEQFEREYEEVKSPVTGVTTKIEVPNPKREEYYSTLIRQAYIVSVTAPTGAVDANWKGEENESRVQKMVGTLPVLAREKLDEAIGNATIAVDFYRELADEVF